MSFPIKITLSKYGKINPQGSIYYSYFLKLCNFLLHGCLWGRWRFSGFPWIICSPISFVLQYLFIYLFALCDWIWKMLMYSFFVVLVCFAAWMRPTLQFWICWFSHQFHLLSTYKTHHYQIKIGNRFWESCESTRLFFSLVS